MLPTDFGRVTGVNGSTITISGWNNTTQTIDVTSSTRYQMGRQPASLTAVTVGMTIRAQGTSNSDGSLTALVITIQEPMVLGKVTAVGSGSYTVTGFRGNTSYTVITTSSTAYVNPNCSTAQASAIKDGTSTCVQQVLAPNTAHSAATEVP